MKQHTKHFLSLAGLALVGASLNAQTVIYEGFADSDSSLDGNTTGSGLTGNWSAGSGSTIVADQPFGNLDTSGNASQHATNNWDNPTAAIDSTALNANPTDGLLRDGGEMWFSLTYNGALFDGQTNSVYHRFAFGIGDGGFGSNGDLATTGDQAIGFGVSGTNLYGGLWETENWGSNSLNGGAPATDDGTIAATSLNDGQTYFIVGHVQWGATSGANDTLSIYLPGTDLSLGSAVASSTGVLSQDSFDTLAFHSGNQFISIIDEVRVGASYADVSPVPEPSSFGLIAGFLGLTWVMLRRRR
ncbi:MAG TPA: hypothetical protein VJ952_07065 [Opitutales bacterium]|nr:hypothetical protein [Opitutales bacterium]